MFVKTLLVAALPLLTPAIASPLQKRDNVDLFIWGSANLQDYDTYYSFAAGACQAIATPSTGHVGSATVDLNASCNVYASSDCSGSVAGTFSAPGISDTGSLKNSFGSVKCSIPSSSAAASTTAGAQASDSCAAV
ncbi:uncharacterized protein TRUGW13939_10454 [Talaromyces rugulosus]|uniref:Uncharacterized protein n=1 Tax=Talaromyces rugulosus TaxID=121627 RepID=A0A7H8RCQ3_TALRU|nr:uncharacterized protein TRUGW13939_10454 [Talaromyces rugulosus]QKX63285.1 hypothetical protein TRUGW13939_10454 [Talaromyces rugulosus]